MSFIIIPPYYKCTCGFCSKGENTDNTVRGAPDTAGSITNFLISMADQNGYNYKSSYSIIVTGVLLHKNSM